MYYYLLIKNNDIYKLNDNNYITNEIRYFDPNENKSQQVLTIYHLIKATFN